MVDKKDICMCAKKRLEREITYPILMQPKLDGVRGIYKIKHQRFYTRTGKRIEGLPTLEKALKKYKFKCDLDGEFLAEEMTFNKLSGVVRRLKDQVSPLEKEVVFHCFDIFDEYPYLDRLTYINTKLKKQTAKCDKIKYIAPTITVNNREEEEKVHKEFSLISEGSIYRTREGLYKIGKVVQLLKRKDFKYMEVEIIDLVEGTGKYVGMLGAFSVAIKYKGAYVGVFTVGSGLTDKQRVGYWGDNSLIKKKVIVKYDEVSEYGIPRFPRFKEVVE